MNRNPMIPPNFVTLRQLKELKEKREEEERLKREEDERLRKFKEEEAEEEQNRLRKLKEEEEESLKNPPKTLGPKSTYRRKLRGQGPSRSANPDAQLSSDDRPDLGTNVEAQAATLEGSSKKTNRKLRDRGPRRSANPDAQLSSDDRPDLGMNVDAQVATLEESKNTKKKKWKKNKKRPPKEKEDGVTEMPLGLSGSEEGVKGLGAPKKENEEKMAKATVDSKEIEALKSEEEKKLTKVSLNVNGSERRRISGGGSYRPVRVIGSESGQIGDIQKGVLDLKMGRRTPNPKRRERGSGSGSWGRGGTPWASSSGSGSGSMMWVKKTTES